MTTSAPRSTIGVCLMLAGTYRVQCEDARGRRAGASIVVPDGCCAEGSTMATPVAKIENGAVAGAARDLDAAAATLQQRMAAAHTALGETRAAAELVREIAERDGWPPSRSATIYAIAKLANHLVESIDADFAPQFGEEDVGELVALVGVVTDAFPEGGEA